MRASSIRRTKSTGPRRPPAGVVQAAQVEDGVADELAGAVIGDVAAAIDLVKRDAALGEQFVGGEDVGAVGVAAEGQDRRMLEQEQHIFDAALVAQVGDLCLEAQRLVVSHAPEIEVLNHRLSLNCRDCLRRQSGTLSVRDVRPERGR